MNYILFDDASRDNLLPFTYTRPVAEIRVGILTIAEKWKYYLNANLFYFTEDYLQKKFPSNIEETNILINGGVCPTPELIQAVNKLESNTKLMRDDVVVAMNISKKDLEQLKQKNIIPRKADLAKERCENPVTKISNCWDIFSYNGEQIKADFNLLTKGKKSQTLDTTNTIIGNNIFIEEGAKVQCATINTTTGPVYIGKNAEVMEGSIIRGPFAMAENSVLKMGAKIYGPTTLGPYCKVGGEVNNSVFFSYSNKGHDGFLGNSVIGEWCNIGADTNTSNLKNNYAEVKLWNYPAGRFAPTGKQFCGLMMGDHSKCGINTMFNTGTVVGVSANIFGAGFPRNFIPSFSWGGAAGVTTFKVEKAYEVAEKMMERRGLELNQMEKNILQKVFDDSQQYRKS